ncbi:multidrug transporter [Leifsonia sp. NPDC058230]|uniref:multidrug transporter n=1 Tax=Leifsonia sp. NPDC058230 TaxID=3346391 RepID=UPI0036DC1009
MTEQQSAEDMSHDEKREDQLTTAPKSTEADAKPRIEVSETDAGTKRIDIRDDANARPGGPDPSKK